MYSVYDAMVAWVSVKHLVGVRFSLCRLIYNLLKVVLLLSSRSRIYKLSDEDFINLINESESYSDVLRKIGSTTKGNSRVTLQKRIKELDIDTSHFIKYKNSVVSKYNIDNAFLYGSTVTNQRLIKIMLENDLREYKCEVCGCDGNWYGKKITLQLHHIDGDNKNNVMDNLQILCPNCHSVTDNYGFKNKRNYNTLGDNKYIDLINNSDVGKNKKNKKRVFKEIELTCKHCNELFKTTIRYSDRKFCSKKCNYEYRKLNKEEVNKKEELRKCIGCNNDFNIVGRKKECRYCSNDCYLNSKTIKLDISNDELKKLLSEKTQKEVANILGITKSSLYRYIKRNLND